MGMGPKFQRNQGLGADVDELWQQDQVNVHGRPGPLVNQQCQAAAEGVGNACGVQRMQHGLEFRIQIDHDDGPLPSWWRSIAWPLSGTTLPLLPISRSPALPLAVSSSTN